jgi:hypothetical protein
VFLAKYSYVADIAGEVVDIFGFCFPLIEQGFGGFFFGSDSNGEDSILLWPVVKFFLIMRERDELGSGAFHKKFSR